MQFWLFEPGKQPRSAENVDTLYDRGFLWIESRHNELTDVLAKLEQLTGATLHQEHVEDCMSMQHPCFFDSMNGYKLLIYRSLMMSDQEESALGVSLKTQPVVFILLDKILITIHEDDHGVQRQMKRFKDSARSQPKAPDALLYQILINITDQYLALREHLTATFGEWQELLLNPSARFRAWSEFLNYKTSIQRFNLLCEGQLDAVSQWQQEIEEEEGEDSHSYATVHLADLSSHILRGLKFSQQLQYQIDSLMQLHYSLMTSKTNEVVQLLTVISCIFLPLTLLTGIFGMNFEHMPFLGSKTGFYDLITFMLVIIVLLGAFFKWRRWV